MRRVIAAVSCAAAASAQTCRLDALWHGSAVDPTAANETAGVTSEFGPLAAGKRWYEVQHAAVGCGEKGCLVGDGHGCQRVRSGGHDQCVWQGVDVALERCAAWAECGAVWCGAATDVANTSASTCWARGHATSVLRQQVWKNATAYLRGSTPNQITATCSSAQCGWVWAAGSVSNGTVRLTRSDGVTRTGTLSVDCGAITWADGGVWTNQNLRVNKVHVVFMAHFDVGYTEPSVDDLLDLYSQSYFPTALETAAELRARGGPEQFAWTSHAWLIEAMFRNQTGHVTPEFLKDLDAAIRRGDVVWHANPMNMQSEAGEYRNMAHGMRISSQLDKRYGVKTKTAASQKDEPGATLGMVKLFGEFGVKMLHIGANDFSTIPAMPTNSAGYHGYCNPFAWQDSQTPSAEVVVLYCSGYSGAFQAHVETPGMMAVIPGLDEALVYLMHVDNRGPQTAAQVLEGYSATRLAFPNAAVELSSMDAWMGALEAKRGSLPAGALPSVTDVEPGSTWIYGVSSQPRKMRWYRAVARTAATAEAEGRVNSTDARYVEFHRLLLKIPEHTWGDGGPCEGDYTNKQFNDPHYSCHVGGPTYQRYTSSWTDQRDFVPRAVKALGDLPLAAECDAAMKASEPAPRRTEGLSPFDWRQPITTAAGITVGFSAAGAITTLRTSAGGVHADAAHPLALFRYATHSEEELDSFGRQYALRQCATSCGHCSFSKCGLALAGAQSAVYNASVTSALADAASGVFVLNLTFGGDGSEVRWKYGAPAYAVLYVNVTGAASHAALSLDLQWYGKEPTRMAESLWMSFVPKGRGAEGWGMDKLGRWVDPLSAAVNGSRTMHAIWSGIRHTSGGVVDFDLVSLDAPVVSPGSSLSPTGAFNSGDDGLPHPERGWGFNLFNNAWATNYAYWSLDAAERFRWTLNLTDR